MKKLLFVVTAIVNVTIAFSQKETLAKTSAGFPINYEEELVGKYTLPDVLTLQNGNKVNDANSWTEKRQPEIIKLFEEQQFGKMPPRPAGMSFNVFDKGTEVLGGKAIRKQVTVYFTKDTSDHKMDMLIYRPAKSTKPSPLLLMINFSANSNAVDDPGVKEGYVWTREGKKVPATQSRGFGKINIDTLISQGIGVATIYYGDIEPDFKTGIKYGIRSKRVP
jgi:hypothetical protein